MMPLRERILGSARVALLTLWSAAGFVLLIACVNVTNLLLARAAACRHETGVRIALGANRARRVRQFLTESTLLALIGGAAGLVLAYGAVRFVVNSGPAEIPQLRDATLNVKVLIFTLAVCMCTGVLSGLAPALAGSQSHPGDTLKLGGRTTSFDPWRHRLHALLVTSELMFALLLVSGAGLMLKSLWIMRARVSAIDPEHVLTTNLNVRSLSLSDQEPYVGRLATQIEAVPGVRAATIIGGGRTHVYMKGFLHRLPTGKSYLIYFL
jgi:cell division protein FtsX